MQALAVSHAALDALHRSQQEREQLIDSLADMAAGKVSFVDNAPSQATTGHTAAAERWMAQTGVAPSTVTNDAVAALRAGISAASAKRVTQKEASRSLAEREASRNRLWNQLLAGSGPFPSLVEDPLHATREQVKQAREEAFAALEASRQLQEELRVQSDAMVEQSHKMANLETAKSRLERRLGKATREREEAEVTFSDMEALLLQMVHAVEEKNAYLEAQVGILSERNRRILEDVKAVVSHKAAASRMALKQNLGEFVSYIRATGSAVASWYCNMSNEKTASERDRVWETQDTFWASTCSGYEDRIRDLEDQVDALEATQAGLT